MKERPPKFMQNLRDQKGQKAFEDASRKGGLVSGGKRSEQAAADRYLKNRTRLKDEHIQAETNKNIRVRKDGDIVPPEELSA